jgi:RNA polymerase sigma-B factor
LSGGPVGITVVVIGDPDFVALQARWGSWSGRTGGRLMLATVERSSGFSWFEVADDGLFRALPDASARDRERIHAVLVDRHGGLVRWLASSYAHGGVDIEELRQVGYVGLMLAIRRFDPDHGVEFIAYARPTVRGEIQRHFRDRRRWIRLPRPVHQLKVSLGAAREELTHTLRRSPSVAEYALFLGVEQDAVREALGADDTFELRSLDEPVPGDGGLFLADLVGGPDPHLDLVVDRQVLRGLLPQLAQRDFEILWLYFFEDWTQHRIGAQFGISQVHVSRLLKATLERLREQLAEAAA